MERRKRRRGEVGWGGVGEGDGDGDGGSFFGKVLHGHKPNRSFLGIPN